MNKLLILLTVLLGTFGMLAQDPDPVLFVGTWYLTGLTVDGSNVEIPSNTDFANVTLNFREAPTMVINTKVCNSIGASITDFTDTVFSTDGFAIFSFDCFQQSTFDFESSYFQGFYRDANLIETFTYTLETGSNDAITLTIINAVGDIALYGNSRALDVEDNTESSIEIFPNPTKNEFYIQLHHAFTIETITLYDAQGRLVPRLLNFHGTKLIQISLIDLPTGMYFLKTTDGSGTSQFRWILKE